MTSGTAENRLLVPSGKDIYLLNDLTIDMIQSRIFYLLMGKYGQLIGRVGLMINRLQIVIND